MSFHLVGPAELQPHRKQLPIYTHAADIIKMCRTHQAIVLVGETGSGKTTRASLFHRFPRLLSSFCSCVWTVSEVPQYLIHGGVAGRGQIAVSQPRRVGAITVAQRVAAEWGVPLGAQVGYTIRFKDVSSPETKIKFLTDGMLLR